MWTANVAQACTVNENGRLYLFHLPFSSGVTINHGNNFFHVGSTPVTLLLFCDDGEFTAFLFVDFVAGVSDDKIGEHISVVGVGEHVAVGLLGDGLVERQGQESINLR